MSGNARQQRPGATTQAVQNASDPSFVPGGDDRTWAQNRIAQSLKAWRKEKQGGEPAPAKNQPVATLELNADVESADRTKLTMDDLKEARVGHAWITLKYKDMKNVPASVGALTKGLVEKGGAPMGFWPLVFRAEAFQSGTRAAAQLKQRMQQGQTPGAGTSDNPEHTGFKMNPLNSYVPGRVEEPDTAHSAKATLSYELTQAQVDSLMAYVDGKRGAQYSLYFFNCTTFAVDAAKAAGQAPPGGAFVGICLPNALYKDILQMKLEGDAAATTTPLGPGEKETAPKKTQ